VILKTLDLSLLSAFSVGTGSSIEKRLRDLDMARHTDTSVSLQRLAKQRSRVFAITWSAAIQQHHCVEAASLGPFEAVGKGFCLLQRDLKVIFSVFPPTRRRRWADRFSGPRDSFGVAVPGSSPGASTIAGRYITNVPRQTIADARESFEPRNVIVSLVASTRSRKWRT
jgi:hypothetical protein